jgi:putative membrane protein
MSDAASSRQVPDSPASPSRANLDVERALAALERTLLAWIRTALALIGAGFTIGAVLLSLVEQGKLVGVRPHAARNLGLTLVGLGVFGLLGASVEHRRAVRRITAGSGPRWSLGLTLATLLALLGALILSGLLFRAGPF